MCFRGPLRYIDTPLQAASAFDTGYDTAIRVMTRLMPRPIAGLCASFTSWGAAYTLLARFDSPGPLYCC